MKKTVLFLCKLLAIPVLLFEYTVFLWFIFGGDLFTLLSGIAFFLFFMTILLFLRMKTKHKDGIRKKTIAYGMIFVPPFLAVSASYLFAWLFDIPIAVA